MELGGRRSAEEKFLYGSTTEKVPKHACIVPYLMWIKIRCASVDATPRFLFKNTCPYPSRALTGFCFNTAASLDYPTALSAPAPVLQIIRYAYMHCR